jgi:radical SAM superfamily enzyme YgiQ (UPF0313 family)
MKGVSTNPRVLLCTAYRRFKADYSDITGTSVSLAKLPRRVSPGLRFIKQNVPEVEILEYPMWNEYVNKLKEGWDVVGFSFYQNEIGRVEKMASEARRQGVGETWAGNYGALDYKVPALVDRVFTGPAENQIAQVFGHKVPNEDIEHPVMMAHFSLLPGLRTLTCGLLYTAHGCPFRCKFCQTPAFEKRYFTINLESIERVLRYYKKRGVTYLACMDELFGINPGFTDKLTRLFARYKFKWWAQSRASLFLHNLDVWHERGLSIMAVGVESMLQNTLDSINKKQNPEEIFEFTRRTCQKQDTFRMAYFMIGYEDMTAEETLKDVTLLKRANFDTHAVVILTPFPRTVLWEELDEKHGIFDYNYDHYRLRHLVWNHPHISPAQMQYLWKGIVRFLNTPFKTFRNIFSRVLLGGFREEKLRFVERSFLKGPFASLFIDDRKQVFFPKLIPLKKVSYEQPYQV